MTQSGRLQRYAEEWMVTPTQAEKVADALMDEPRRALDDKQVKRNKAAEAERRRRESPLLPALISAIVVSVALGYLENVFVCILIGAAIGTMFGWAARRR